MTGLSIHLAHVTSTDTGRLEEPARTAALKGSGVRHASVYGLQVALGALAAKAAFKSEPPTSNARLALITNGGPWAADTAVSFLKAANDRGPQFVNPLIFPATLVSSGPAAIAIAVGAGAAAIAVGHDELAFFEMLRRGSQFIGHNIADEILLVAACASSPALQTTLSIAGRAAPVADWGIAFVMSKDSQPGWRLIEAVVGLDSKPWPDVLLRVEALINADGLLDTTLGWPLRQYQLLSATCALMCKEALQFNGDNLGAGDEIAVSCRMGPHTGGALFRWCT